MKFKEPLISGKWAQFKWAQLRHVLVPDLPESIRDRMELDIDMRIPGGAEIMRVELGDRERAKLDAEIASWKGLEIELHDIIGEMGEHIIKDRLDKLGFNFTHLSAMNKDSPRAKAFMAESGLPWGQTLKRLPDFIMQAENGSDCARLEIKTVSWPKTHVTCPIGKAELDLKRIDYLICVKMGGSLLMDGYNIIWGHMDAESIRGLPLVPGDARNGRGNPEKFCALSLGNRIDREAQREANWRFSNRDPERAGPIIEPFKAIGELWDILRGECLT